MSLRAGLAFHAAREHLNFWKTTPALVRTADAHCTSLGPTGFPLSNFFLCPATRRADPLEHILLYNHHARVRAGSKIQGYLFYLLGPLSHLRSCCGDRCSDLCTLRESAI